MSQRNKMYLATQKILVGTISSLLVLGFAENKKKL